MKKAKAAYLQNEQDQEVLVHDIITKAGCSRPVVSDAEGP